jgi:hypothetical protein
MPNTFNINNSINPIKELNNVSINQLSKLDSFDIIKLYTNTPKLKSSRIVLMENFL